MFNSLHLINLLLDVVESYINDFFVNFYIYIIFDDFWFVLCWSHRKFIQFRFLELQPAPSKVR